MPTLIRWTGRRAEAAEDPFTTVADDEPIPPGDVIVSLPRFQAEGERLLGEGRAGRRARRGRRGGGGPRLRPAAHRGGRAGVPEVPRRPGLLRRRASCASASAISGEVRAVGDVLREQARFMVRCGFDAFEPADGSTPEQWTARRAAASATSTSAPPTAASRPSPNAPAHEPRPRSHRRDRQSLAARLDAELRDAASAGDHRRGARDASATRLALVSSFGAESAVLLHMAAAGQAATSRCSSSTPACCSARRSTIASSSPRSSA